MLKSVINGSLTLVALLEIVDPEVESVQAEPPVLPDDGLAGADDAVGLFPDHGGLAWNEKSKDCNFSSSFKLPEKIK